jgi:hypothetical protein
VFNLTAIQNLEKRNDSFCGMDTENKPMFDTVVFHQSDIRKKDFLQFVFFRNEEIISCYQTAMHRIRGSGQKKLLSDMIERKNRIKENILEELAGTGDSFTGKINCFASSDVKYLLDTDLRPVNSIIDVFSFISKKEQKELELFGRLADLEENPDVKEIFLEQSRICEEHISDLEIDFTNLTLEAASSDVDICEI